MPHPSADAWHWLTFIGSGVPRLQETFGEIARRYCNCTPLSVNGTMRSGIKVNIDNPSEAGADKAKIVGQELRYSKS